MIPVKPKYKSELGWSKDAIEVFEKIILAHGGWDAWEKFEEIKLEFQTFSGFLPLVKGNHRKFHKSKYITIRPKELYLSIHHQDHVDVFDKGKITYSKEKIFIENGKNVFKGYTFEQWKAQHVIYFVGYAMTNYLSYPFILPNFELIEFSPFEHGYKYKICFPKEYPNHCPVQTFFFSNKNFLLKKFYYVTPIGGPYIIAAHYPRNYTEYQGLQLGLTRHVLGRIRSVELPIRGILAEFSLYRHNS